VLKNNKIRFLISSLLTFSVIIFGYSSVFANEFSFESPSLGFYPVKVLYHTNMNDYFNEKIKKFVETDPDDPSQFPPSDPSTCTDENLSTYCVSMGATDRYVAYMKTLDNVSSTILSKSEETPLAPGSPQNLVSNILSAATNADSLIKKEREEALAAMDTTINAYNEFRMAYPMHLRYQKIISELNRYRDFLSDMRSKIDTFPAEFSSVTSDSCK